MDNNKMTTTTTTTTTTPQNNNNNYEIVLVPPGPADTKTADNTHNIALRLFNRDTSSPIPCIVFGALHSQWSPL